MLRRAGLRSFSTQAQAKKTVVNSWDEFSPLKHIILGVPHNGSIPAVCPASNCKIPHDSDMRGIHGRRPQHSIDRALELREKFAEKLRSHGIRVDAPTAQDYTKRQASPMWDVDNGFGCAVPRDTLMTIGNEILFSTMSFRSRWWEYLSYRDLVLQYWKEDPNMKWEEAPKPRLYDDSYKPNYLDEHDLADEAVRLEKVQNRDFVTKDWHEPLFDAADCLRLGKDLFVQNGFTTNQAGINWIQRHFPDHRVHALDFPGDQYPIHIDCTLVPLKAGLLMSNPNRPVRPEHKKIFEDNGWQIVDAPKPAWDSPPPLCYSSVWLSMNTLVLDEKHIVCEASELPLQESLKQLGFEPVPVDWRDCYAFGGSFHCWTADVYREGGCNDYFPNQENRVPIATYKE